MLMDDRRSLQLATPIEPPIIPLSRFEAIKRKCSTMRETANECSSYYVQCHPLASWTHLVCPLYYVVEFAAVEKVKPHLPLRGEQLVTMATSCLHNPVHNNSYQITFCVASSTFNKLCQAHLASYPGPTSQLFNVTRKKARGGPGIRRHGQNVIND